MGIIRVRIKGKFGHITDFAVYPDLDFFDFKKREDELFQDIQDVEFSVDNICEITKALMNEGAINTKLEPSPNIQRLHEFFKEPLRK